MFTGKTMVLLVLLSLPTLVMAGNGPRITFDKQTHDYGKVKYGETVTEEFVFTNSGDETLVIEQLRASCGCTKAIKGSSRIPAGGKSKIVAELDTSDLKPGMKQKAIYVHSNDPQNPMVKLILLADVVKEVNISPPSLVKKLSSFAEKVTFPVKISNASDRVVSVSGLQAKPGDVQAALEPERITVEPHGTAAFDVNIKLPREQGRSFYMGRLTISTDHPSEKKTDLSYRVEVEQPK
jgi:hypothetical protein